MTWTYVPEYQTPGLPQTTGRAILIDGNNNEIGRVRYGIAALIVSCVNGFEARGVDVDQIEPPADWSPDDEIRSGPEYAPFLRFDFRVFPPLGLKAPPRPPLKLLAPRQWFERVIDWLSLN